MNSRERILAALALHPTDKVPVFPRDLTLGMDICGYTTPEVCNANSDYDAVKSAESVMGLQAFAGHDAVVGSIHDLGLEADLFGGETGFPEYGLPSVATPPIQNIETLRKIRPTMQDKLGRWRGYVDAFRRVHAAIGGSVALVANIEGPVTKTCLIRGMSDLAMDMFADPDFVSDVIDFSTDLIILRMKMLADAGADFLFLASACDDPGVIGPENFRKYSLAPLQRIVEEANKYNLPTVYHPHGCFTTPKNHELVEETIATGISGFQFAEENDLALAKKLWGDRICILGGLDAVEDLEPGPVEAIQAKTTTLLDSVGNGSFILMASCSLHRGLNPEHLLAMVEAAHNHRY